MRRPFKDSVYPADWPAIAQRVKEDASWRCLRCHVAHGPVPHILTVHHLDGDKGNGRWWNLVALCQRCHLRIQGCVRMERPWILEHTPWFRIYAAGFYAWKYLGLDLSRTEVEARLDELLALEKVAVLSVAPQEAVHA